jgi:hypothetical protein
MILQLQFQVILFYLGRMAFYGYPGAGYTYPDLCSAFEDAGSAFHPMRRAYLRACWLLLA